jgi:hypothetical protein
MNDPTAPDAGPGQDRADRLDRPPQPREIGAEPMHVASFTQEVVLHVDHHKGGRIGSKGAAQGKMVRLS